MSDSPPNPFAFEPVASATNRRDGWTAERQRLFIETLAAGGIVSAAARRVGKSRKTAYELLKRAGPGSGFARAWQAALAAGRRSAWRATSRRWLAAGRQGDRSGRIP